VNIPGTGPSHRKMLLIAALVLVSAARIGAEDEGGKKLALSASDAGAIANIEKELLLDPFMVSGVAPRTQSLQEAMQKKQIPALSVAVIDDNRIVWAKAYGISEAKSGTQVNIHTLFSAGSLSKFITAIAVLRLVDQGQLSLDADINQYLKSWRLQSEGATITLRQLLSHTSGITQHFPVRYALDAKLPTTLDILQGQPPARNPKIKIKMEGKPGEQFDYSGAAFSVVQRILEEVAKKPFADVVNEQVFKPAGMTESTFEQPTPSNYLSRAVGHINSGQGLVSDPVAFAELASVGLWTTPSDLARLVIRLRGPSGILPEKLVKEMLTPVKENSGLGVFLAGDGADLWFRVRTSDGRPIDGFCGWLTGYVGTGKGAIIMANSHSAFNTGFALLRAIAREYKWPGYLNVLSAPDKPIDLQAYVGKFQLDTPIVITKENESLVFSYAELERLPMLPTKNGSFVANFEAVSDFVLTFHMGPNGKADKLTLTTRFRKFEAPRIAEPADTAR
jgi:CubicO group peptidase (beta-lactamase class C family)